MRIATYNVEWFTNLFNRQNQLIDDDTWSGRRDVTKAAQTAALGQVFAAIDADAVMIIEAPDSHKTKSTTVALKNFANRFRLRTSAALSGFSSETQQEIALLYDPEILQAFHDPRGLPDNHRSALDGPRFDSVFRLDIDLDDKSESISFSKPPLEVQLTTKSGRQLRLIGVHAKSKAPHGARNLNDQIRIAIANRRKQLAQCIWLRRRVDTHLAAHDSVIVLGDFNDGPGLDEYEKLFGQSSVEVVLGSSEDSANMLFDPHASVATKPRPGVLPSTSRFFIKDQGRYLNALLDYIMVSPDLRHNNPRWQIWHPFDDTGCFNNPKLRRALLAASDHFPVTLDIDL